MRYDPFTAAAATQDYEPKLGLQPLLLKDWLEPDGERATQLKLKREILEFEGEEVFQFLDAAEDGALELHEILWEHIEQFYPQLPNSFTAPQNGRDALAQITVNTQEDWVLLSPEPPVKIEAGSVCFPSRWSIQEKIGLDSSGVHASVPQFGKIARPTQNFLERITVERPVWRLNWTIHDSDVLCCPRPVEARTDLTPQNVLNHTYLRMERQTLRRLPQSHAVAFSIRTYLYPMLEVATPERRDLVRETLKRLPTDTASYRGMRLFHQTLIEALK